MKPVRLCSKLCLTVAVFSCLVTSTRADLVKFEAESGSLGSSWTNGANAGLQYIAASSNISGNNPTNSARVATYTVTFPAAGIYDLYVHLRVGSGAASDDSLFYGNGFGSKSPTSDADWILCNNLNTPGFTAASDVVTGGGTAGNQVWKWINLSEFNGGESPITFTVTAGNLTQTFQIGARENGLNIDALVLGTASLLFTVADLDAGADGSIPPPGSCTVNWNDVHQRIDGFGASCAFSGRTWLDTTADMFFSTNTGIGLSLLRNQIQSGGFATTSEIGLMQKAQARGAKVWSAPWSPQASFKDNNNTVGGNFLSASNQAYANQLAGYVVAMQNTYGVNLYALSIQNEPDANVSYVSCHWNAQQLHDFVPFLYNALVASNVASTKIMLPESQNWGTSLYAATMNDANVASSVAIIANHNYVANNQTGDTTTPAAITNYGKALWETEVAHLGNALDGSITNAMYWAGRIHLFLTAAQVNAWHYWWLISGSNDNEGLAGPGDVPAKRIYVLGQYSRFVRPGYFRIGVSNGGSTQISAYKDTNSGKFVVVAINSGASPIDQTFSLTNFATVTSVTPWITSATLSLSNQPAVTVSNSSFIYILPAMSVVTFVGQGVTNSPPTDISLSNSTVSENQPSGTIVGAFNTTDPDSGNTFTYTLVGGTGSDDNASFNISGSSLRTSASFDYETENSYSVRLRSTDQGGLFFEKAFTITITNVNEAPALAPVADKIINAGATLTITNVAIDPESPSQTLTFSLLSSNPTNATLNASNGIFSWRPLLSQANTTNLIIVKVADSGTPSLSATNNFKVMVNPLTQPAIGSIAASAGQISLVMNGPAGPDYTLLTSTNLTANLTDWQILFTTNSPLTPVSFVDTNLNAFPMRFYRIQIGP